MEGRYENMYIRPANWQFGNIQLRIFPRLAQVACWAQLASTLESAVSIGWVNVHLCLYLSRVSGNSLRCNVFKEGNPEVWFWQSIAGCVCITAFTCLCPENSTPHFFCSWAAGPRHLEQILCFLDCGARNLRVGQSGHIQSQAHVGLFQLYPTSLPCHSTRHVENLQDISCYF
jgi:hypothetical protein